MNQEVLSYVGVSEDLRHEFKLQEASLDGILADVVAFLNTEGGVVVLGVDAPGPESVAVAEPGVAEPSLLKDRLEQSIPSRVDPPPSPGSIMVSIVRTPAGTSLVRVEVSKSKDGPHALRHGNTATFWVREGSHRRALSVGEAYSRVRGKDGKSDPLVRSEEAFRVGIECASAGAGVKSPSLFVGFQPTSSPHLTETAWTDARRRLVESLSSETPLGLRRSGYTFALWPHWKPETGEDRVLLGRDRPLFRFVEVRRDGTVWGAWSHEMDARPLTTRTGQQVLAIPSMVVAEFAVSVARLTEHAMNELGIAGGVTGRIALFSPTPILLIGPGELAPFHAQVFGNPVTDLPLDTGPISWNAVMDDAGPTDLIRELLTRWFDLAGDPDGWRPFRDRNGRWFS